MIAFLAIAALVGLLIILFRAVRAPNRLDQELYQQRWQRAQSHLNQPNTWPLAVIEADKILDRALKDSHFSGQTMVERLSSASAVLANYQTVWRAHKLRNQLVHEPDAVITKKQAKRALAVFQQALTDIGVKGL